MTLRGYSSAGRLREQAEAWPGRDGALRGCRRGNASGQVFPHPVPGAELHPSGREMQRGAASAHACHQALGGRVRRPPVPSRAARTHLSELGQAVRPYLEEVQRQSQQAKHLATSFIELKGTPLKLGVMCTIGPGNFVGLLTNLQAQHPGIELQITDAAASDLQGRLLDGGLEAAIYCWPDQIDERLHYLPLFREQFFIVLGRQHRLANRPEVRVGDLNGERYLNRINCEQADVARDVFAQRRTKVERVYRSDRDDWILAMVAAGLGFAFMPRYSIVERADIVARL